MNLIKRIEKMGPIILTASLIGVVIINYTHGFKPALKNIGTGISVEASEQQISNLSGKLYCHREDTISCDPRIIIYPITFPGRYVAYASRKLFDN